MSGRPHPVSSAQLPLAPPRRAPGTAHPGASASEPELPRAPTDRDVLRIVHAVASGHAPLAQAERACDAYLGPEQGRVAAGRAYRLLEDAACAPAMRPALGRSLARALEPPLLRRCPTLPQARAWPQVRQLPIALVDRVALQWLDAMQVPPGPGPRVLGIQAPDLLALRRLADGELAPGPVSHLAAARDCPSGAHQGSPEDTDSSDASSSSSATSLTGSDRENAAALRSDDAALALERRMDTIAAAVLRELGHEPMALRAALAVLIVFEPEGIALWPRQDICQGIETTLQDIDDRAYAYAQTRPEPLHTTERIGLVRRLRLLATWAPGFDLAQTFGPQGSEGAQARSIADAAASVDALLSAFGPHTTDVGGVPEFMLRRATARLLLEGLDDQACAEATAFVHGRIGARVARDLPMLAVALSEIADEAPLAADILEVWQACAARLERAEATPSVAADGLAPGGIG